MPYADQWEELGYVPREVLREMGELGFLGIRYPAKYGGSELDTLATVVLAEELPEERLVPEAQRDGDDRGFAQGA